MICSIFHMAWKHLHVSVEAGKWVSFPSLHKASDSTYLLSGCLAIRPQPGQDPLEVAKALPSFALSSFVWPTSTSKEKF